jgi:antimicrobial peptide system SdpA family protein
MEKKAFFLLSCYLLIFSIFYLTITSYARVNASLPGYNIKSIFNTLLPEGWGFFTRNPREPIVELYKIERERIVKITIQNGSSQNFWGISRKSRKIGMEMSMIAVLIKSESWYGGKGNFRLNIPKSSYIIKKPKLVYFLSGEYLVVSTDVIPWAWASHSEKIKSNYKIARVNIVE